MTRDELAALEAERAHLLAIIAQQTRAPNGHTRFRLLMVGVLIAVIALAAAGIAAGDISIMTLILCAALTGLAIAAMVPLALHNRTDARRRLAACEARIAELKTAAH